MITDKLGQEITRGSWIVYGHALGRCAALKIGRVLEAREEPNPRAEHNSWVAEHEPLIYRILVRGVEDDSWQKGPKISKKGTLQFPNRIVVLDAGLIQEPFKSLLKDLKVLDGKG